MNKKISDNKQVDILREAGIAGSIKANRESKALGLTVKYIEDNKIVEVLPNGEKNVINILKEKSQITPTLKKGTTLWRK